jgi:AcrR family transcriptional regulator
MGNKRIRDSERSREDILNAAEQEFAEKGIYGARVDEIAAKANINKRMIYEYFGNKEELYKIVLIKAYSRLGQKEIHLLSEEIGTVEAIKRIIVLYFEFLRDNPTYVNLILWENLNRGSYIQNIDFSNIKSPSFSKLSEIIARGKEEGVIKQEADAEQFILSLLTFSFSYFSNRYTLSKLLNLSIDDELNIKKRIDHVTEMFLAYLCN